MNERQSIYLASMAHWNSVPIHRQKGDETLMVSLRQVHMISRTMMVGAR